MDIGTAKPTPEERARAPHHLVDLVDPGEEFSVARSQPLARAAIAEVLGREGAAAGRGLGLYFQAVVDDFVFLPTDQAVRARLEAEAATVGLPELYRRLAAAVPSAAARIQPGTCAGRSGARGDGADRPAYSSFGGPWTRRSPATG